MASSLETPVQYLKGVGPRLAKLLSKINIKTIKDLIYFFPRDYEDRRKIIPIRQIKIGEEQIIVGQILQIRHGITRSRTNLIKVKISDGTGQMLAIWFNQPFLMKVFKKGLKLLVSGKAEYNPYDKKITLSVRNYEILEGKENINCIMPIYQLTEGLYQKIIRKIIKGAIQEYLPLVSDVLPYRIKFIHRLSELKDSIYNLHFPEDEASLEKSRYRLVFDEFFIFQLGLALKRREITAEPGIAFEIKDELIEKFERALPFKLTSAQGRVLGKIKEDMARPRPMNRLLQGDVGSGKTIVAAQALMIAVQNGYQAALMAPTEILAQQHYSKIREYLKPLGIKVKLLTSGLKLSQKKKVREDLEKHRVEVVVGTHALIEENVKFLKLGLVIIDEQHRFGVLQRTRLKQKGYNPDLLVMTATPIPRTLALSLYGDLDRSVIDEMPPGRTPIKTFYKDEKERFKLYEFIRNAVKSGRQVYVVYPLVEETEKSDLKAATEMAEQLRGIFPEFKI